MTHQPTLILKKLRHELYEAETLYEAACALARVMPQWLPWVGAGACIATYITTLRIRLFIARWRRAARRRAEQKYFTLRHLNDGAPPPAADSFTLVEDDIEEDELGEDDTALTVSDIEEFRCSLGIRCPRDNDLLVIIEEMLLVDDIPDGWVLYRTTAGVVRFMNLNTQELFFFHPGRRDEELYIRSELKRRNKVLVESKYNIFSGEEESSRRAGNTNITTNTTTTTSSSINTSNNNVIIGSSARSNNNNNNNNNISPTNTSFALRRQRIRRNSNSTSRNDGVYSNRAALSFDDNNDDDDEGERYGDDVGYYGKDEQSTFHRLFHYFVEREERKIERDVEKRLRYSNCGGNIGNINSNSSGLGTVQGENRSLRVIPANIVHNNTYSRREGSS